MSDYRDCGRSGVYALALGPNVMICRSRRIIFGGNPVKSLGPYRERSGRRTPDSGENVQGRSVHYTATCTKPPTGSSIAIGSAVLFARLRIDDEMAS